LILRRWADEHGVEVRGERKQKVGLSLERVPAVMG